MQVKKLATLVALACIGFAGQASAALSPAAVAVLDDANDVANGGANPRVVYVSGASAVQKGIGGIAANLFSGTPIWFANSNNATSGDYFAVAGTYNNPGDAWHGLNVIYLERVVGGSVWGVNPVARATPIPTMNVSSGNCGSTGTGASATTAYSCGTSTLLSMVPDAGVSDVAPAMFQSPINTEGETPADSLDPVTELPLLTSTAIYGLAFGVPVTTSVPTSVKFTKSLVAALYAGNVGTWAGVPGAGSGDVVICRRVPGSGTQAVYNSYFGNFPCTTNYNVPADRYASGAWDDVTRTFTVTPGTGGVVVVENSTSNDVKSCLDKAVNGGSYPTKDRDGLPVTVNFTAAGNKAIGTLSMDSLNGSTTTSNWTFRNMDGDGQITWAGATTAGGEPIKTGTGKNAEMSFDGLSGTYIDGTWDLQGWISFNIPARTTGAKAEVLNRFLTLAQAPSVHGAVSALKYVTASVPASGYTGARVLKAEYLAGDQCAPYNKNN